MSRNHTLSETWCIFVRVTLFEGDPILFDGTVIGILVEIMATIVNFEMVGKFNLLL